MDESTRPKSSNKPQRVPKCTRCQNHGKKVVVKTHKNECEFRFCLCRMCILTTKKQQITRQQTAQRRERQRIEEKKKMMEAEMEKSIKSNQIKSTKDPESVSTLPPPPPPPPPLTLSVLTPPPSNASIIDDQSSIDETVFSVNSTNNEVTRNGGESWKPGSETWKNNSESVVYVPLVPNLPHVLPYTPTPSAPFFVPEPNPKKVEILLGYSKELLEYFRFPLDPLILMYIIVKHNWPEVQLHPRITRATIEIQSTEQFNALKVLWNAASLGTLSSSSYVSPVSPLRITPPPAVAGLDLLTHLPANHIPVPEPTSPGSPPEQPPVHRLEPEQVEILLRYSEKMLQFFGPSLYPLLLMYINLKDCNGDVEIAIQRILMAANEVQVTEHLRTLRLGNPFYYWGYSGSSRSLTNPMYSSHLPLELGSPPTAGSSDFFSHPLRNLMVPPKELSSPGSPPDRPSSNPGDTSFPRIRQTSFHS